MDGQFIKDKRQIILDTTGHLLVEGGPGSGKTTIALTKAGSIAAAGTLRPHQRLLFLSFARATIARVSEQAAGMVSADHRRYLEINTYHGFCWQLIQSYGYLVSPKRHLKLITPPYWGARSAGLSSQDRKAMKDTLFKEEGLIGFDHFAELASSILEQSPKITQIISGAYPYIMLDEFQDTEAFEWKLIKLLGTHSSLMAMADLEQRIYEFRGASVTRIPEFVEEFDPVRVDLGRENFRSPGTDIATFGNDLLTGANVGKAYTHVRVVPYQIYRGPGVRVHLLSPLRESIRRLKRAKPDGDWSIAVLVKRKLDTLNISAFLTANHFDHEVIIDPAGPALAAVLIATLLQPPETVEADTQNLMMGVIEYIRGKKGENISVADLTLVRALEEFLLTGKIRGKNRVQLVNEVQGIIERRTELKLMGVPETDWISIRNLLEGLESGALNDILDDARYIRLLRRGAELSASLSEMWRAEGSYKTAAEAVNNALTQEHFSMANRAYRGVYVMNIHKAKGKEFDEVIIWEELHHPIVWPGDRAQGALLLRVAITRARSFSTFLTPSSDPCVLI
jgi:ATP-dependent DNA helicase UvrD/PcrA